MRNQRIILAGGGTGGHIFPAVAIANAIKRKSPETEILFIGAKGKMEMEKVPQAGYNIEGLTIAGFNRSSLIKNISLPFKLVYSFFQVASIFKKFKPTAVIGVGGYSSFPVLKYAQTKGIATFIHESNSFAGKSNILLGKKATMIFTGGSGMEQFFPAEKLMVSGNPVRSAIVSNTIGSSEAKKYFGLNETNPVILCVGGSLGAKNINEALHHHLPELTKEGVQLIWQTGKPFKEKAMQAAEGLKGVYVTDFVANMEFAYNAADVVVSRSGAMAVAELCVVKKPVVFVPFPFAAEDHQTVNAQKLVNVGAAMLIKDNTAMDTLIPELLKLIKDKNKQEQLIGNISKLAVLNADEIIADKILDILN